MLYEFVNEAWGVSQEDVGNSLDTPFSQGNGMLSSAIDRTQNPSHSESGQEKIL